MNALKITAVTALAMGALITSPLQAKGPEITPPAHAQPDQDQSFDEFIRSIDTLLTRDQMEALWPDAKERLIHLSKDLQKSSFERWRATSLLTNFVDPDVQDALSTLTSDENERVRSMAYYTLGTTFLNDGDDALFDLLKAGLKDPSERVRADVVRSLGWTDHKGAPTLLEEVADDDNEYLKSIAERSLKRLR